MFPTKCDTEVPVTDSDPNRPKDSGVRRKQLLMKATQRLRLGLAVRLRRFSDEWTAIAFRAIDKCSLKEYRESRVGYPARNEQS